MTSKEEPKPSSGEERRRSPLDHLPPPANSNKPLTPFSIEDILNKPSVRRSYTLCGTAHLLSAAEKHPPAGLPLSGRALLSQTSPLCALEELASKTFKGLEVSVLQAAEAPGKTGMDDFGPAANAQRKRRKSRTAFTTIRFYELEKRFLYQKYLSRRTGDQIAQLWGYTKPAQVITWSRTAAPSLKRTWREMKGRNVESGKKLGPNPPVDIVALAELGSPAPKGRARRRPGSPPPPPRRRPGARCNPPPPPPRLSPPHGRAPQAAGTARERRRRRREGGPPNRHLAPIPAPAATGGCGCSPRSEQ
ncbi:LOW QUALITY PROTEIN: transcription factor LBX1 [Manacus vitellinus]|uniref:LOW QUALITY PROTEIN: transcription factor LBX1 n=1 Tax=Manacus vitellinus TaxID=328815 RepID=UPI00115F0571|nr:LOW QUALITY PROTEIN: transcription factor LBX1 [Manacus vitellinus]